MSGSRASGIYPEEKPNLVPACEIRAQDIVVIDDHPCRVSVFDLDWFFGDFFVFLVVWLVLLFEVFCLWIAALYTLTAGISSIVPRWQSLLGPGTLLRRVAFVPRTVYKLISISEDDDSTRNDVKLPPLRHNKFQNLLRHLVTNAFNSGMIVFVTLVSSATGQGNIVGLNSFTQDEMEMDEMEIDPPNDTTLTNVYKVKSKADATSFEISTHIKLSNLYDSLTTTS